MPRNHPPAPDYAESGFGSEKRVWEALQALPDDAVVISQYRVLDDRRVTREADFLVLLPGVGVGVVEVKGGLVWTQDGDWCSRDRRGHDHWIHNPILQAQRAGYAVQDFLQEQGVRMPDWVPVAVVPDTRLLPEFHPADSSVRQWIDRDGLKDLAARLGAAIYTDKAPSAREVDELVEVLEQRLPKPVGWEKAQDAAAHADMLTRDQYAILRALRPTTASWSPAARGRARPDWPSSMPGRRRCEGRGSRCSATTAGSRCTCCGRRGPGPRTSSLPASPRCTNWRCVGPGSRCRRMRTRSSGTGSPPPSTPRP